MPFINSLIVFCNLQWIYNHFSCFCACLAEEQMKIDNFAGFRNLLVWYISSALATLAVLLCMHALQNN